MPFLLLNWFISYQCHTWNEGTNAWEESGIETVQTVKRNSSSGEEASFTTCNVTKMAYVALFEGPPSMYETKSSGQG